MYCVIPMKVNLALVKDRDILRYNPHQVIEGMAIACYAMGAQLVTIIFVVNFVNLFNACEDALAEAVQQVYWEKIF